MRNSVARRAKDRRKGSTLVELSIVVALLSLIAVLTVSFCTLIGTYVQRTHSQYDFLQECDVIQSEVSDWLSSRDDVASTCQVSSDTLLIGTDSVVFFPGSRALRISGGGRTHNESFKAVTGIAFSLGPAGGDHQLLKCTVTGGEPGDDAFTLSFLLAFRCGGLAEQEAGDE